MRDTGDNQQGRGSSGRLGLPRHDLLRGFALMLVCIPAAMVAQDPAPTPALRVRVDLKPGDEPTTVNPRRGGMLPVAILSSSSFDATSIDAGTVRFEKSASAAVRSMHEDVDGDDRLDLFLLFRSEETGIECGDDHATITGRTQDQRPFSGSEEIQTVGCEQASP